MTENLPIGVFDSGVGGLTVLRALQDRMPHESFLYLGDTARLPYGARSPETVRRYAIQATDVLVNRGVKALVVACNTASAVAIDVLRERNRELLVEGVIEPGAAAAVAASRHHSIAVIGTEGTINGGAYQRAVQRRNPDIEVTGRACSLLVSLAEEGWLDGDVVDATLDRYFDELFLPGGPDVLVLGCTHFPVLAPAIRAHIPDSVALVDSAETTAEVVARDLIARGLLRSSGNPKVHFLVTDNAERFTRTAGRFLGETPAADNVELVDL